ncbi:MAG TPA: hypothetical protein VFS00_32055 [Polyangiaceae bacterium]|nr:hypothetical protein [Polyangiaceae bacterium]
MTDESIQDWISEHQIVTYTGALVALGALAGLLRPRTPEEEATFVTESPHLAALVELVRTGFGIDAAQVKDLIVAIWTGKLLPKLPLTPTPPTLPSPAPPGAPALPPPGGVSAGPARP